MISPPRNVRPLDEVRLWMGSSIKSSHVSKALNISAHRFTKTAKDKIEKAGGSVTEIKKVAAAAA